MAQKRRRTPAGVMKLPVQMPTTLSEPFVKYVNLSVEVNTWPVPLLLNFKSKLNLSQFLFAVGL